MAAPASHSRETVAAPPDSEPTPALGAPGAATSWTAEPPCRRESLQQDPQPLRSRRQLPSRHAKSIGTQDMRSCGNYQSALGRDDARRTFLSRATSEGSADYRMVTDLVDGGRGIFFGGHACRATRRADRAGRLDIPRRAQRVERP